MFVVRELDGELAFVFRLRCLTIVRFAKSEPRVFPRRGPQVANGANRGAGAGESLSREELLSMAANTGVVIGKVCCVGKISLRRPRGREFVTGVAPEALVFVG